MLDDNNGRSDLVWKHVHICHWWGTCRLNFDMWHAEVNRKILTWNVWITVGYKSNLPGSAWTWLVQKSLLVIFEDKVVGLLTFRLRTVEICFYNWYCMFTSFFIWRLWMYPSRAYCSPFCLDLDDIKELLFQKLSLTATGNVLRLSMLVEWVYWVLHPG